MSQKNCGAEVQELIKCLNQIEGGGKLDDMLRENNECFGNGDNFYGSVARNILIFRLRVLGYIDSVGPEKFGQLKEGRERNIIKLLCRKLAMLNSEVHPLLQDGILTLFIDLNDIREHCNVHSLGPTLKNTVRTVIEELDTLLRQYFAFQEYQNYLKKKKIEKRPTILLKKSFSCQVPEAPKTVIQQLIIKNISIIIEAKPLSELFEGEMKKEENRMDESEEICRICFERVQFKKLEKHVNNCAKNSEVRLQLEMKNTEILGLEELLKEKYLQICSDVSCELINDEFKKLCKLILSPSRKEIRNQFRRNSLIGVKSQQNINGRIEAQISDFLEFFGVNELLQKILIVFRERTLIEKHLGNLQRKLRLSNQNRYGRKQDCVMKEKGQTRKRSKTESHLSKEILLLKQRMSFEEQLNPKKIKNTPVKFSNFKEEKSCSSSSSNESPMKEEVKQEHVRPFKKCHTRKWENAKLDEIDLITVNQYYSLRNIRPSDALQNEGKSNIELKDFQVLEFLGAGAFGKVYMVRRIQTRDIYALKIIKLPDTDVEKELIAIKNEHEIFKKIAGNHLVKAPFSFSQNSCHIFVLQYMPGGDLRKLLTEQVYFEQKQAKCYIAEIILAIEHLHTYGIIHRDLKPENLVIDRKGHLKLTDFGLSEFQISKKLNESRKQEAKTIKDKKVRRTAVYGVNKTKMKLIGTPDYIAPQIINQTSLTNYSIDWWSLGVMAYELIIGNRPFCANSIDQVVDNITNFNIEWPEVGYEEDMISPEAKDFISKLLSKDFTQRLGAGGVDELKGHTFMKEIDWDNIKTSESKFLPSTMTKVSDIVKMKESQHYRQELKGFMNVDGKKGKELQLETFIRFDLLKSETIEDVQSKKEQTSKKLKKLRTLKDLSKDDKENTSN